MKFAIAELNYFNSLGFDTTYWRKSLDGTKAIVHYDFAKVLCGDDKIEIYQHDNQEFLDIINGEEWVEPMEEELEEEN